MLKHQQTRFWKVQALYQFLLMGNEEDVTNDFRIRADNTGDKEEFFKDLPVIISKEPEFEEVFLGHFEGAWKWDNLNLVVKAIFISAMYDLRNKESKKQIISDYVGIAKIFGEDESANFIHANLDQLEKKIYNR